MGSDKHFLHACAVVAHISIHAPRMGSDLLNGDMSREEFVFQSTLPHGERLTGLKNGYNTARFQSTPPRMGSDPIWQGSRSWMSYFNPRPPHGERL